MTAIARRAAQQLRRLVLRGADARPSSICPLSSAAVHRPAPLLNGSSSDSRLEHFYSAFLRKWANGLTLQQVRGVKISGSEVKIGFVIERKGRIEKVLKAQHTTQGRGGATIQVELRDVQTGLKSTTRLRTSEAVEKVFVDETHYTFLYEEEGTIYLMDPSTFEQIEIPKTYFETGAVYLKDGMDVAVQYFDGKPLSASVPPRVTCTVVEAEPSFKGQTATPTYKRVVLENGQQIMTPTFISSGDAIVVDTTDDSYVTRSKD